MKVFVVVDANDSWGEIEAHGVFLTMSSARKSLNAPDEIIDDFLDNNFEIGKGHCTGVDCWEFYNSSDASVQEAMDRVMNKTISETELNIPDTLEVFIKEKASALNDTFGGNNG